MKIYKLATVLLVIILCLIVGFNLPYGEKYLSLDISSTEDIDGIEVVMNEMPNDRADITVNVVGQNTDISMKTCCIYEILDIDGKAYPMITAKAGQSAWVKGVTLEDFSVILSKKPCETDKMPTENMIIIKAKLKWQSLSLYDRIRFST